MRWRLPLIARLLRALGLLAAPFAAAAQDGGEPVTLFAAASTADAVNEIAAAYAARTGGSLRPVIAASSTLARQIAQGAPADLYLSASTAWMDHLEAQRLLVAGRRRSEAHTSELQSLMRISYAVFCLPKKTQT